jgi:hypothetical protein
MAELTLELAAELGERRMLKLESLEDDRCAVLELRRDPIDPRASGERRGRPRDVLRVVAEHDLPVLLDDPERGMPEAAGRDAPLDLGDRQEVEKAPLLVARDEEGLPLPVLTEEALGFDW